MGDDDVVYYDDLNTSYLCPAWASILGFGGCVIAVVFASKYSFTADRIRSHDF